MAALTALTGQSLDAEFSRAMALASGGKFAEAATEFRRLTAQHPNIFELEYRLGLILLRTGEPDEAAKRLQRAVDLNPDAGMAWLGLAQAQLRLKAVGAAKKSAIQAASLGAKDPPVWRALALFYSDTGAFVEAAAFEERWSQAHPDDASSRQRLCELWIKAGRQYRLHKDPAKAVEAYQHAMTVAADQPASYLELATLFLDHRTPEPALAVLVPASTRFPKDPELHRLLGLARYQTGDTPKAIDAFFAVIDIDPHAEIGYASLETLLPDAGPKLPEMKRRLAAFHGLRSGSPVGPFLLAKVLTLEGAPAPEVEALMRRAIAADAKFWPAYHELAQIMETRGDATEAIRLLKIVIELNPEYAPAHAGLARLYARINDRARAVEHRSKHHAILARQSQASERSRAEFPALPYRLDAVKPR